MADRHRRGYVSEANKKLRTYGVKLRPETIAAWKKAAARAGMDQRQAVEHLFCTFAREQGVDAPPPLPPRRKNGKSPPSLDC